MEGAKLNTKLIIWKDKVEKVFITQRGGGKKENVKEKVENQEILSQDNFKPSRYQKELIHTLFKLYQRRKRLNTFQFIPQDRITLISKLCKKSIRKKKENYRQISLENFDLKLLK